ncbi:Eco57I restriction-modification methylase domain-containing protein [Vallitalea guaymasensis]|uniref:site-specific DNA-methyltransferase (adenine-specific) n=1 Tax=Vallitalea guaymasensis TaxID=1185412 RepID=A0A8J8SBM0_9FIRM|nr:Eco57I restriction-modification methylase domain-containing protein [Vallitalea guaymasensis]QUH28822.1 Eco57I restriction-modification methylase domain-containing protein [Vallitalea guaymasensis]
MNNKDTGSFYTPRKLMEFMTTYIDDKINHNKALEPSAGDGIFLDYLSSSFMKTDVIELYKDKIDYLLDLNLQNIECHHSDYLDYKQNAPYDLIIGNPPYINKKSIPKSQNEKGIKLAKKWGLTEKICKNMWVYFILKSVELVKKDGSIFFVLPYEFLQVNYAMPLRNWLEEHFKYINIIIFNEKAFNDIDQEICLVLLSNTNKFRNKGIEPYISLEIYNKISTNEIPVHQGIIERNKPINKWSNSILNDNELDFLKDVCQRFSKGSELFTSKPGIVTGANSYFLLTKEEVYKYGFYKNKRKIISKSSEVSNKLIFSLEDHIDIINNNKKAYVLNLSKTKRKEFSYKMNKYIKSGQQNKVNNRYKCSLRKRWYDIRLGEIGELIFFKRYHLYPRMIINEANCYTTDIGYNIFGKEGIDLRKLAFCFYNSLTMTMCEYNGRFYGGGVCELTPSEFRNLPFPQGDVSIEDIKYLDYLIRKGRSIEEITEFVDSKILTSILSEEERRYLINIKSKLLERRLKNIT